MGAALAFCWLDGDGKGRRQGAGAAHGGCRGVWVRLGEASEVRAEACCVRDPESSRALGGNRNAL